MRLVRFIKQLGCDHLKINAGPRSPAGTTDDDLQQMSKVFNQLGKDIRAEGLQFAVHAHMWSQFENRREIDSVMGQTDPGAGEVCSRYRAHYDGGNRSGGLTQALGHRIIEFHLKDTKFEHRGGAKHRLDRVDLMANPIFFPLGMGGVDFPAIKTHLDKIGWRGWLTVELDTSPARAPLESARISRAYLKKTFQI